MTNRRTRLDRTTPDATVLRWEFTRGNDRLACQVDLEHTGHFAVAIVSPRRLTWTPVERFKAAAAALRRHATVVSQLRASGWKLVAYTR